MGEDRTLPLPSTASYPRTDNHDLAKDKTTPIVGDACYFMDRGQITYQTRMDEIERDSEVLKKHLGVSF